MRAYVPAPCSVPCPSPPSQAARVEQHAFVAEPAPAPSVLGSLLHTSDSGPFGPTAPVGGADGSGWVLAAGVLLAARLGRLTAQEARLDVRKLQASVGNRVALRSIHHRLHPDCIGPAAHAVCNCCANAGLCRLLCPFVVAAV